MVVTLAPPGATPAVSTALALARWMDAYADGIARTNATSECPAFAAVAVIHVPVLRALECTSRYMPPASVYLSPNSLISLAFYTSESVSGMPASLGLAVYDVRLAKCTAKSTRKCLSLVGILRDGPRHKKTRLHIERGGFCDVPTCFDCNYWCPGPESNRYVLTNTRF